MLRRRIFSSAMASVMALSSIAVVANAEETNKEYMTKEDLKAYVDSLSDFRDNDLYDYGSISGEKFLSAIEFADNVINDAEYGDKDAAAAYSMLKAVKDSLVKYSAEKLKGLINKCTKTYEQDNLLNEELSDAKYDDGAFQKFVEAYDEAVDVVESGDSRIITDAYEVLDAAYNALSPLPTVKKADFTAAIKALEKALMKEKNESYWRRGSTGHWTQWLNDNFLVDADTASDYWRAQGANGDSLIAYSWGEMFDAAKIVVANANIYEEYDKLVDIKSASETSNTEIVTAYNAAKDIADAINAYTVETDTKRGSKSSVAKLLNQYNGRLVYEFENDAATTLFENILAFAAANDGEVYVNQRQGLASEKMTLVTTTPDELFVTESAAGKLVSATLEVKVKNTDYYIILDETTNKATGAVVKTAAEAGENYKKVSKGVTIDLADYIYVNVANVADENGWHSADWSAGNAWGAGAYEAANLTLKDAIELAYEYQAGDWSGIQALVTIDEVTEGSEKGSTAEWTLVNRALKYALTDRYADSVGKGKTKKDVEELVELTYELEKATSEAAIFANAIEDMVTERQYVNAWLKLANSDKKYKDNISGYDYNGTANTYADGVYNALKAKYDTLAADKAAFAYSYGEIYDYIADVCKGIDAGEIEKDDKVAAALKEVSYRLSTVKTPHEDLEDEAFTEDRYFISYNRVFTDADGHDISYKENDGVNNPKLHVNANGEHAALKSAYEILKAAIEAQKTPKFEKGDVDKSGKIDLKDALLTLKAANGSATVEIELGDMNDNKKIDLQDALAILKKANA